MHREILCLASLLILASFSAYSQPKVPASLDYCGMHLILTNDAKAQIEGYVYKIHESPRYFNEMVKRAHIYMPFIREAFANVRIPDDLAYLAIQESSLRPDVVSSSNAVGFWQFKEGAAKDFGLRVNDKVDERSHIYRASEAAAMYLASANEDFDNWVYAVMAYYHGLTGAVEYTDPAFYGKDTMTITADLHWYVLKAIAHKIAYEEALSRLQRPMIALYPFSTDGEIDLKVILEKHHISEEEFMLYNKWILNDKKLPRNELFTYYIPQKSEYYAGHMPDPNKVRGGGAPVFLASNDEMLPANSDNLALNHLYGPENLPVTRVVDHKPNDTGSQRPAEAPKEDQKDILLDTNLFPDSPKAKKADDLPTALFAEFELKLDLHYGIQYVLYDGKKSIADIANTYEVQMTDLLVWNGLLPGEVPDLGMMIYLTKPAKTT
ncbi:MAG: lytic transglycosylase domain-containing protein, partial [Bacteroidetes bacterium]|nr:lytic transglycosylase domain-containing protein [Bacteroidota bacterium]